MVWRHYVISLNDDGWNDLVLFHLKPHLLLGQWAFQDYSTVDFLLPGKISLALLPVVVVRTRDHFLIWRSKAHKTGGFYIIKWANDIWGIMFWQPIRSCRRQRRDGFWTVQQVTSHQPNRTPENPSEDTNLSRQCGILNVSPFLRLPDSKSDLWHFLTRKLPVSCVTTVGSAAFHLAALLLPQQAVLLFPGVGRL